MAGANRERCHARALPVSFFVAGGGITGYGKSNRTRGVIGGHPSDEVAWNPGPTGSMFGVAGRYLRRAIDYRSVLGEIIRDHLGATPSQLNRIIPGYANPAEALSDGGQSIDLTQIMGEVGVMQNEE